MMWLCSRLCVVVLACMVYRTRDVAAIWGFVGKPTEHRGSGALVGLPGGCCDPRPRWREDAAAFGRGSRRTAAKAAEGGENIARRIAAEAAEGGTRRIDWKRASLSNGLAAGTP